MKTALISVYKKDGILDFTKELVKRNFNIISTGGTYKHLKENGVEVNKVDELTGFPEILGGRVKTLNPIIFGGILADRENNSHAKDMSANNLPCIDLVVVNLYPFQETISKPGVTHTEAIEKIDIGGVSLIRAAAKNHKYVAILTNPEQYSDYLKEYDNDNNISGAALMRYSSEAFRIAAEYDIAISNYFKLLKGDSQPEFIHLKETRHLRYGENPHQYALLYKENFDEIFKVLHGKEISYNNLLDIEAALSIINEFRYDLPATVIVKHGNPCGIAVRENLTDSYTTAFETDTESPFGGIIIFNRNLDFKTSQEVDKLFTEIILAPEFEKDAFELLSKKKNRRLIEFRFFENKFDLKRITGGYLYQKKDNIVFNEKELKFVTVRKPDEAMLKDALFAFKVVKHTKSNAVVFVKDGRTLGIGGGQPSRVDSTKIAIMKSVQFGLNLKGSIVASDAFFPFADSIEVLSETGAECVIQPGGSVRDDEVIKAADKHNLVMIFTGIRHFKH
ncbi:MAG: bifunctional phosphoribosylaminoimidazolecarboxamide formyltransferase/IMP cyclohydrolase [Ignavibacteria bacterium]|nr:bifunctional phosphoribosylaminoimidazolecarboxamide formyltransferase/IMP cyclohydrolase [Ignavibacteria bacterium]